VIDSDKVSRSKDFNLRLKRQQALFRNAQKLKGAFAVRILFDGIAEIARALAKKIQPFPSLDAT
jgi:hypothetical protein